MPSHGHLVLFINGTQLSGLMRDFKKYTGQKIATNRGIKGGIWMPRYDRVAICSAGVMRTKLEYIHHNSVKAGLAALPADWRWSSAADYLMENQGPLPVWKDWWRLLGGRSRSQRELRPAATSKPLGFGPTTVHGRPHEFALVKAWVGL